MPVLRGPVTEQFADPRRGLNPDQIATGECPPCNCGAAFSQLVLYGGAKS